MDSINRPIKSATVSIGNLGAVTDEDGSYEILVPAGKNVTVRYGHVAYNSFSKTFRIQKGKTLYFSPRLYYKTESIDEVIIIDERANIQGLVGVDRKTAQLLTQRKSRDRKCIKNAAGSKFQQ